MNKAAWKYYISFYKGLHRNLLLSIVLSLSQLLLVMPVAFLVRRTFDQIIPSGDAGRLILVGMSTLLLVLLNSGIALWTRWLSLRTTKLVIRNLRDDLLTKSYSYSRSYYNNADIGKLHAGIVQDTERVDCMSNAIISIFFPSSIVIIILSGVLIYINWFLFLLMMVVTPPLYLINHLLLRKKCLHRINKSHRAFERFSSGMLFVLQMMELTRTQNAESFEIDRQRRHLEDVRITGFQHSILFTAYNSAQTGISAISGILILIIGGISVGNGTMTLGSLIAFYVALSIMRDHLRSLLLTALPQILEGSESVTTLYDIAQVKAPIPYTGQNAISFAGEITLKSVNFGYKDKKILNNVSLDIKPGAMSAIIGPNGVGKSTIVHLIMGFYRPEGGCLLAGQHRYDEIDMACLRSQIGYVMQDPMMFPGTILENMTYGYPDAGPEEIEEACRAAAVSEFIHELPEGYNTLVGEKSVLLSGGQRQRIAIARGLLRRPKLLILDEPTNHLDPFAVHTIMENLKKLKHRPAIVMVTQDMDIAKGAETVFFLRKGGHLSALKNTENLIFDKINKEMNK